MERENNNYDDSELQCIDQVFFSLSTGYDSVNQSRCTKMAILNYFCSYFLFFLSVLCCTSYAVCQIYPAILNFMFPYSQPSILLCEHNILSSTVIVSNNVKLCTGVSYMCLIPVA